MSYWMDTGRALYTNNVHLLSDNQNLQADSLEVSKAMEKVVARGDVRHLISRKENSGAPAASDKNAAQTASDVLSLVQSSTMTYLKEKNRINYSGKVKLHSKEADITSDEMDAVPDPQGKKIRQATAKGNVVVQYGVRSCKGDVADYYLDSKKLIVTGKPAEFYDPVKGRSYARRLTSTTADDTILLDNEDKI
jgi:lipopolysaccharide export system protein LptA